MTLTLSLCLERSTRRVRMQDRYQVQGEGGIESLDLMPEDRRWLHFFCACKIEGKKSHGLHR